MARQREDLAQQVEAGHVGLNGIVPQAEGASCAGIFFEDPDGMRLEIYSATGADDRRAPFPDAPSCGLF